ncbi:ribonucleoside hydrolase RihC, partial [Klebsiella aerogenes]
AEFNIAIDPEAAAKVFQSGLEIVMCGLDVTNKAMLSADYLVTLPTLNQTGKMLHALFSHYRSGSMSSGPAGATVVDIEGRLGQPANAQVALDLDVAGFQHWAAEVFALAP